MAALAFLDAELLGQLTVMVLNLVFPFPQLRQVGVPQDGKEPCLEVRVGGEARPTFPCLDQRLLDQIVGLVRGAAKRSREGAQVWDKRSQLGLQIARIACCHSLLSDLLSDLPSDWASSSSSLLNLSGSGSERSRRYSWRS